MKLANEKSLKFNMKIWDIRFSLFVDAVATVELQFWLSLRWSLPSRSTPSFEAYHCLHLTVSHRFYIAGSRLLDYQFIASPARTY